MRKVISTIILSLLFISPKLIAQDSQSFALINKTGLTIEQLYISLNDIADWGEDVLGVEVLPADGETDISYRPSGLYCMCDLKIVDVSGQVVQWNYMDLCDAVSVTIYLENGVARAEVDNGDQEGN